MPVGVPKVLYYWDDELPLQWIDLYNLIFRRRLVFVMSELDQDLCNQIAGMMVYIHFEDKRKELEKKGEKVVDLFEQTLEKDQNNSESGKNNLKPQRVTPQNITYQNLMDYSTIWDFEAAVQKDVYLDLYNGNDTNLSKSSEKDSSIQNDSKGYYNQFKREDYLENASFPIPTPHFPQGNGESTDKNALTSALFKTKEKSTFREKQYPELNQMSINLLSRDIKQGAFENLNSNCAGRPGPLFKMWASMLPILAQYKNNKYFSDLGSHTNIETNFFNKNDSTGKITEGLRHEKLSLQKNTNLNEWWDYKDRETFKESIKRACYQDTKDQEITNPHSNFSPQLNKASTYSMESPTKTKSFKKALLSDQMILLQNIKQNRPESEDFLFSETQERLREQRRVFVFINSTGGSVTSGITIYDSLQFVQAGAVTVCLGMAFSASSMILAGGNIGHRYVSEGGHVMIHQPEGGMTGQASDVLLDAYEIMRVRRQAATIYTLSSKRSFHEVLKDLDRDYFLTPQEAIDYGLADEIVTRYNAECILDEFEKDWLVEDSKQIEGISKKIQQYQEEESPTNSSPL
jgi:ATP-dependent Clp protease, protease subunit